MGKSKFSTNLPKQLTRLSILLLAAFVLCDNFLVSLKLRADRNINTTYLAIGCGERCYLVKLIESNAIQ